MTEFARPQAKPASRVNLGDAIMNLRSKITAAAGERVAVELTVNRAPVLAMADPEQLGEVLSAAIAGPRNSAPRDRTRITIAWDVETVAERLSPTALAAGKYARITIRERRAWTRCRSGGGRVRSRAEQDRGCGGAGPGARL